MVSTVFKRDEVIVLLGAGASVEAGIPDSTDMVRKVEDLVQGQGDWQSHQDLYNYIRSSIYYAEGIQGKFDTEVQFNIETLVNVLDEIQRKENHTLYPFVGAWNQKLVEVAGTRFENVDRLLSSILEALRSEWVVLRRNEKAGYYEGLARFQQEYGHQLRVFSLNYDLCVELTCGSENVQRGFSADRLWDWRLFDQESGDPVPLLLYKLHGSVDWYFDENDSVTYSDSTSSIGAEKLAMIFGTSYKFQYVDPFLFLAYELRRWTLDSARVIVAVGYGFNDEHINGILEQALRQNEGRKLLAVVAPGDEATATEQRKRIAKSLNASLGQVDTRACGAEEFLGQRLTVDELSSLFPDEPDLMPEFGPPHVQDSESISDRDVSDHDDHRGALFEQSVKQCR